jgi:hypothetical protein
MIAPLAAIPVFAVVGVPQFAPVSASQADDDSIEWNESDTRQSSPASETPSERRSANDLFAPVTNSPSRHNATETRPGRGSNSATMSGAVGNSRNGLPPPEALDQWEVRPDTPAASNNRKSPQNSPNSQGRLSGRTNRSETTEESDNGGLVSTEGFDPDLLSHDRTAMSGRTSGRAKELRRAQDSPKRARDLQNWSIEMPSDAEAGSAAMSPTLTEQAGWESAAKRLKSLGIRKYRLESQIEERTFIFTCNFTTPENPRIVRRFEAEADTPLEAVENVLGQIDEWRSRDGRGDESEPSADDAR